MGLKNRIEQHVIGIACGLCLFFYLFMFVLSFSRATVWHFESHTFGFEALNERLLWPLLIVGWFLAILSYAPAIGIVFLAVMVMAIILSFKKNKILFLIFWGILGAFFSLFTWGIWTSVP